jgi:hypothetical protein
MVSHQHLAPIRGNPSLERSTLIRIKPARRPLERVNGGHRARAVLALAGAPVQPGPPNEMFVFEKRQ